MEKIDTPLVAQKDGKDKPDNQPTQQADNKNGPDYVKNIAACHNDREQAAQQWRGNNQHLHHTPRVTSERMADGHLVSMFIPDDDMPHSKHENSDDHYIHDGPKIYNIYNDTTNMQINHTETEPEHHSHHSHRSHQSPTHEPNYEYNNQPHHTAPDQYYHAAPQPSPSETESMLIEKQNTQYQQLMLIYIAVAAVALFALMSSSSKPHDNR